jgi:putative transcriptional regulator
MRDPHFAHSVIYICEHSPEGAMGIVINLPLNIHLGDVFQNMNIATTDTHLSETPVLAGGPVQQERGFVIHRSSLKEKWESSLALTQHLSITTSKDILQAIAEHKGPRDMLIALGYASWAGGQLEEEIAQNSWLCSPADPQILFDIPAENRWRAAAALLGVDIDHLSSDVGHA